MRDWSKAERQLKALNTLYAERAALTAEIDKEIAGLRAEIVEIVGKPTEDEQRDFADALVSEAQGMAYENAVDEVRASDDYDVLDWIREQDEYNEEG